MQQGLPHISTALPWTPGGSEPALNPPESLHGLCTFPSSPPPRAGQRINEQVWKPEELSAKACSGCVSMQELEQSLADWAHSTKEVQARTVQLTDCVLTEDASVLKEHVDHLHRQWGELCLRVRLPPLLGSCSGTFTGPGSKGAAG